MHGEDTSQLVFYIGAIDAQYQKLVHILSDLQFSLTYARDTKQAKRIAIVLKPTMIVINSGQVEYGVDLYKLLAFCKVRRISVINLHDANVSVLFNSELNYYRFDKVFNNGLKI